MTDTWKLPVPVEPPARVRAVRRDPLRDGLTNAVVAMLRGAGTVSGGSLMLVGLVFLPLPIPLGVPLLALGGFVLWHSCPPARGFARAWLARHPGVTRRGRSALRRFGFGKSRW